MLEEARRRPLGEPTMTVERAADAFHLATAVLAGADRFITSNRRDFGPSITEIDVLYPDALDEP
jgi:hypothetical protein